MYNNYNMPVDIWKDITPDIVDGIKPYYMISMSGKVYSKFLQRNLNLTPDRNGYLTVSLKTVYGEKRLFVHRLVMMIFKPIENADEMCVNHEDGIKGNPHYMNLEWVTHSENTQHAYDTGLIGIGENHPNSKLDDATVNAICSMLENRIPFSDIVEELNLPKDRDWIKYISDIKTGTTWRHISCNYDIPSERTSRLFLDSEIHHICKMMEQGMSNLEIYEAMNLPLEYKRYHTTFYNIRTKRRYTNISDHYTFFK